MNNQHEKIVITQFTKVGWVFIGSVITCTVLSLGFLSHGNITYQCFLQLMCLAAVIAGLASISTEVVSTSIGTRQEIADVEREQQVSYVTSDKFIDHFHQIRSDKFMRCTRDETDNYIGIIIIHENYYEPMISYYNCDSSNSRVKTLSIHL